jgi:transcription elongation factor GreA
MNGRRKKIRRTAPTKAEARILQRKLIADIEGKLGSAEIIDVTAVNAQGRVVFGATVQLLNLSNDSEVTYRIVGEDEADIKAGLVSINSPVARGRIGKREGDTVVVQVPSGAVEYEILAVLYL